MKSLISTIALVLLGAGTVGCSTSLGPSNLTNPGTAAFQQGKAQRFDPYPENEAGPELVGVRPPDYLVPPPEPKRARWIWEQGGRR